MLSRFLIGAITWSLSYMLMVCRVSGAPVEEREALFISKLVRCKEVYDFSDPRTQFAQKEEKRRYLVDIMDYVSNNEGVFTPPLYKPLFDMFTVNLFRALPTGSSRDSYFDQEDDEPFLEPSWPHLQIVYELLRKFVVSADTDPKLVRANVNSRFVLSMVELFNSEDPREREYLKTILHRIYGKIMQPRPFIRRSIMNVFHRFVYETHRHNGIAELLEIIGSIINGFAVPLKNEHKTFLRSFLIPLHTPKALPSYHVQLSFCITQFVEKEPELACDVVKGLVRHWPVTHSRKEVMLLNELEELLELTQPDDFAPVIEVLFTRIALCIESPHFQVAERALFFWNNEYIVSLIVYFRAKIVPIVYGALHKNVQSHWNPNVLSLSFNVQKLLSEMDPALYQLAAEKYFTAIEEKTRLQVRREKRWTKLEAVRPIAGRPEKQAGDGQSSPIDDRPSAFQGGSACAKGANSENLSSSLELRKSVPASSGDILESTWAPKGNGGMATDVAGQRVALETTEATVGDMDADVLARALAKTASFNSDATHVNMTSVMDGMPDGVSPPAGPNEADAATENSCSPLRNDSVSDGMAGILDCGPPSGSSSTSSVSAEAGPGRTKDAAPPPAGCGGGEAFTVLKGDELVHNKQ